MRAIFWCAGDIFGVQLFWCNPSPLASPTHISAIDNNQFSILHVCLETCYQGIAYLMLLPRPNHPQTVILILFGEKGVAGITLRGRRYCSETVSIDSLRLFPWVGASEVCGTRFNARGPGGSASFAGLTPSSSTLRWPSEV